MKEWTYVHPYKLEVATFYENDIMCFWTSWSIEDYFEAYKIMTKGKHQ